MGIEVKFEEVDTRGTVVYARGFTVRSNWEISLDGFTQRFDTNLYTVVIMYVVVPVLGGYIIICITIYT